MDDDLRIRVAEAIGSAMYESSSSQKWPGLNQLHVSSQDMLLAAADAAIAERDRAAVPIDVGPLRISDSDLRAVLGFHREAVDIVWGAGAHIEAVTFVEGLNLQHDENEGGTEFRAGATYWTGDGPRATPVYEPHPMKAGIHSFPVPDAS